MREREIGKKNTQFTLIFYLILFQTKKNVKKSNQYTFYDFFFVKFSGFAMFRKIMHIHEKNNINK